MGFNKQKLLQMMSQPSSISEKELEELYGAVTEYPYFQLGHTFIAKAKHDMQAPDAYESLGHAAVYAPSRRLLRQIFYNDLRIDQPEPLSPTEDQLQENTVNESQEEVIMAEPESSHEEIEETKVAEEPDSQPEETSPAAEEESPTSSGDDSVHRELEENLNNLRVLREQNMEDEPESREEESDKKKMTSEKEDTSSLSAQPAGATSTENEESSSTDENMPYLLDYLKDMEPIQSEQPDINQKRQMELIDKFMTSERDVRIRWRVQEQSPQDLSEKNVEAPDNFATENLADIYVKQGKKDKAIQIYEKLSLKYPQKKTYFAEKIESLKEK